MTMLHSLIACFSLIMWGLSAQSANAAHALALGESPKYPPHYRHFDYVNPDAPQSGTLNLPAIGSFDTLNPFTLKGNSEAGVYTLMFDTLAVQSLDEPFSMYGLLAQDMQLASDGLSVTFTLDPRARFSDDTPVQAHDVKHSFEVLTTDPAAHPVYKTYWADIARVITLDDRTVRFEFKRRNAELHLIIAELPVFSRKWGAHNTLNQHVLTPPLASGPYQLEHYQLGKFSTFVKRANYWAQNHPSRRGQFNFQRVRFHYLMDESVRLEAFKAGEFDVIAENVAKTWAKSYQGSAFDRGKHLKARFPHRNPQGMQGLIMNLRRPLFQDRRVRHALGLVFDFEWLNQHVFYNQYTRSVSFFSNSDLAATGSPSAAELKLLNPWRDSLAPEIWHDIPLPPKIQHPSQLRQQLIEARKLLHRAGWRLKNGQLVHQQTGQPFHIRVLLSSRTYERILAPYQRHLARLGITLDTQLLDSSVYQQKLNRFDFDMTIVAYGTSLSPGNLMQSYFASHHADEIGSQNLIGLKHPAVDAVLTELIHAHDRSSLITASRALDRILRTEHILIPNWHLRHHRIAWKSHLAYPRTLPLYYQPIPWIIRTWWEQQPE